MPKILFFISCLIISTLSLFAQSNYDKANPSLSRFLQKRKALLTDSSAIKSHSFEGNSNEEVQETGVLVSFNDKEALVDWLDKHNYSINTLLEHSLTCTLPTDSIESLLALPCVDYASAFNHRRISNNKTRSETNADIAIDGTGLYAPYTGKGVVIGVIDQGFQYTHPAFRKADGSSRILAVWQSEAGKRHNVLSTSNSILNAANDGISGFHGTHVMGIAAGGRDAVATDYYGIAPDADLVVVPCRNLEDTEIINGIDFISKTAQEQGKPYVVNMSFGTVASNHNGKDAFSKSIDELSSKGGILVAAAGNNGGQKIHARATFKSSSDSAMLYIPLKGQELWLYIVSQDNSPFTVKGYKYNSSTKDLSYVSNFNWEWYYDSEINTGTESTSRQYYAQIQINASSLYPGKTDSKYCVAFLIQGSKGKSIDAWICDASHEFGNPTSNDTRFKIQANDSFCISSPADAESVITVTSHAAKKYWTAQNGNTYTSGSVEQYKHSKFASLGPLVNNNVIKPTVSAPGAVVASSVVDYENYFTATSTSRLIKTVNYQGTDYYYGIDNGTSMSSPVVAGAVAIWLEASPDLTSEQVRNIIIESSRKDEYTGDVPNATWGYGKLDVYEGLKQSLLISGIKAAKNTDTPFTLQSYPDHWSVLLNNDEDAITARLISTNGQEVWRHEIDQPMRGQDFDIPTGNLAKGIYILNLKSTNSNFSRKIVVR